MGSRFKGLNVYMRGVLEKKIAEDPPHPPQSWTKSLRDERKLHSAKLLLKNVGGGEVSGIESKKFLLQTRGSEALIWGPGDAGQLREESLCWPGQAVVPQCSPSCSHSHPQESSTATHRAVTPFRQKNPQCSPHQLLQTHSEILGLEVALLSKALGETWLLPSFKAWQSEGGSWCWYPQYLRVSACLSSPSQPPHQADQMRTPVAKRRKIAPHRPGQAPRMCPWML